MAAGACKLLFVQVIAEQCFARYMANKRCSRQWNACQAPVNRHELAVCTGISLPAVIVQALDQLCEARRILGYSFVFAFYFFGTLPLHHLLSLQRHLCGAAQRCAFL